MPVSVQVPVQVVVDPRALRGRLDELDEAVEAAATRALTNAVAAIDERRGGYVTHRATAPVLTWRGDGLPRERLEDAEERVRQALGRAIAATLPAPRGDGDDSLAARLTAAPGEIVDPTRLAVLAGLYAVPSYRDGDAEAVPTHAPITADPDPTHLEWLHLRTPPDFHQAMRAAFAGRGTVTGRVGAIFRTGEPGLWIGVWQLPEDTLVFPLLRIDTGSTLWPEVRGTATHVARDAYSDFPAGASYRLRYLGPGQTTADRRESLHAAHGGILSARLREEIRALRPLATEAELAAEVEARLSEFIDALAEQESATPCYLELLIGGSSYVIPCAHDVPVDLDVVLEPLVHEVAGAPGEGGEGGDGDGGDGDGTGDGTGQGTGEGEGGPGGPVLEAGEGEGEASGALYPPAMYESSGTLDCSAFNGEPPLDELGADGQLFDRLIAEIAADLQIQPCAHAARFCINAAFAIHGRAASVADHAEGSATFMRGRDAVVSAAGIGIVPAPSHAVLLLRHLATVVPKITDLGRVIQRIYAKDDVFPKLGGPWNSSPASWNLHFLLEFTPAIAYSVGRLFVRACQVVLLQSLRASAESIDARLASLDVYTPVLKKLILGFVLQVEELDVLHDRLESELDESALRAVGRGAFGTWQGARGALADVLAGRDPLAFADEDEGELVRRDGAVIAVRDRHGNVWTLDQLRQALELRRGSAIAMDPLVAQIIDDDEILGRFRRSPDRIGEEISALLTDMRLRNAEITAEVRASADEAFGYGRIHEDIRQATVPGSTVVLGGIHLLAHQQIGEFFRGDAMYGEGLDRLFSAELGKQSLTAFAEIVGITALAILCAPAAIAVGGGLAIYRYTEALEREALHRSLISPEAVITRAEVETDLFFAELELALAFLPHAGKILRGGQAAVRTVARRGVVAGTASLARTTQRRLTVTVARQLREATVAHVMAEIVEEQIEDQVLDALVFQPIAAAVQQQFGAAPPARRDR